VFRRAILFASVLLAVVAAFAGAASAEGPRLAIMAQEYGREVFTVGPLGEDPRQIVDQKDAGPGVGPSWSAAGDRLAFAAEVYPDDDPVLGVVDADGGNLRIYPNIPVELGGPVMAPDGRSAAFARVQVRRAGRNANTYVVRTSIWSFDFQKGSARPLTRWQGEFLAPSSYSPDGSTLAATGFDFRRFRAVAIDVGSGRTSLLARDAAEPSYSPDGSSFAFVRLKPWLPRRGKEKPPAVAELRVGRVSAPAQSVSLLRMRGFFASPSWDPAGQRLAFVHFGIDKLGNQSSRKGNSALAINADGTCLTKVFSDPHLTLYGATWQPGPGREAGPISC
jgi:Tol biopolymer transport system component